MNVCFRFLIVLSLAATCVAAPAADKKAAKKPKGISKEKLEALVKGLEANAQAWLKDEAVDEKIELQARRVVHDENSLTQLRIRLAVLQKPSGVYVAYRLLDPLQRADKELIRKVIASAKSTQRRVGTYMKMPPCPKGAVKLPGYQEGFDAEQMLRRLDAIQEKRQKKMDRERPVAKHNRAAYRLEQLVYRLLLLADETKHDNHAINMLVKAERMKLYSFIDMVGTLGNLAPKMEQERAEKIHKLILKLGTHLKWKAKSYLHPGKSVISPGGESTFFKQHAFPGIHLLNLANKLAKAAKAPAVKVPIREEIDAHIARHGQ